MFLWTAIACLALSIVLLNGKLVQTRHGLAKSRLELDSMRPLPFEEVARQFEEQVSRGPIVFKVEDVRYSAKDDVYNVSFSWPNPAGTSHSEIRLVGDGFGVYRTDVDQNRSLSALLGYKDGFSVIVKSRSIFEE